jgi:hypothetical protein
VFKVVLKFQHGLAKLGDFFLGLFKPDLGQWLFSWSALGVGVNRSRARGV